MLINKTKNPVLVRYNQRELVVEPGASLDVRDFGVPSTAILGVERHVVKKNPDVFDQEDTKDILETNKEYLLKIDKLEKEVSRLTKELDSKNNAISKASDRISHFNSEKEGLKNEIKSLKNEVGELKAKVKKLS